MTGAELHAEFKRSQDDQILHESPRLAAAAPLAAALLATSALADGVVNVYSYRQPELIKPLLDAFTADTGIKTNVLFLDKGLEEKIAEEGANSPADVILTVDIGRIQAAEDKGVTQPLTDEVDQQGHPCAISRPGRQLVRRHHPRPRGLCLEGAREAGRDHL